MRISQIDIEVPRCFRFESFEPIFESNREKLKLFNFFRGAFSESEWRTLFPYRKKHILPIPEHKMLKKPEILITIFRSSAIEMSGSYKRFKSFKWYIITLVNMRYFENFNVLFCGQNNLGYFQGTL